MKKFLTVMIALTLMLLPCICSAESRIMTGRAEADAALINSLAPALSYTDALIQRASEPELTLNLDITLLLNDFSCPVMNLYVDGRYATTVYGGQTLQGSCPLSRGTHTLSIEHVGDFLYYADTFSFSLTSDQATVSLIVKDHDFRGYYDVDVRRADVANWRKQ